MSFCSVKCPLCGGYMARIKSKRGKPFLGCAKCGYGVLLLKQTAIENLNKACQNITEANLPSETQKRYRGRL